MARVRALAIVLGLVAATAQAAPRTLKIRFPPFPVPPKGNLEACYFVRMPLRERFDVEHYSIRHRGVQGSFGVRHFLAFRYDGDQLGAFAADSKRIVLSRGCQDLGPPDRDHRQLITLGGTFPDGVALPLMPAPDAPGGAPAAVGILLDAEWVNGDTRLHKGSTVFTLYRARPHTVRRLLTPIRARTAERALEVPPDVIGSTETSTASAGAPPDAWGAGLPTDGEPAPTGPACVVAITGHMHERAALFGVDRVLADGTVENPADGLRNPITGLIQLFVTRDFTDPGYLPFSPPLLLRAGESLHYACWDDNGAMGTVRRGCEESPGVVPGIAAALPGGGAAKPCKIAGPASPSCPATDPAYPGRTFTGACVAANLVAGTTPDDEVCALAGFYYDPAPDGGCDLAAVPPLE